jgi:uncharacterized RDD family membrane protein YckC
VAPPNPIDRVLGAVVPRAVGAVDLDELLDTIDVNAVLARIDVDAIVARVDIDNIVSRVDMDALLDRVDVDRLMERIDIAGIISRAQIDAVFAATAGGLTNRLLALARRQLVGLDVVMTRLVRRVFRRSVASPAFEDGTVTGELAGGASRLAAFALDWFVVSVLSAVFVWVTTTLLSVFTGHDVTPGDASGGWYLAGFVMWFLLYLFVTLALFGRTVGMAVCGLRVTAADGAPLRPRQAFKRTVVFPFSFILGLGLIGIVYGERHRALHDVAAPSLVRYDWGDRPAAMPAPLTQFLQKRGVELTTGATP